MVKNQIFKKMLGETEKIHEIFIEYDEKIPYENLKTEKSNVFIKVWENIWRKNEQGELTQRNYYILKEEISCI